MERLFGLDLQLVQDVLITGINVFLLFVMLSYLLYDPVRKFLQGRREKIRTQLTQAEKDQKEAAALKEEYEQRLAQAKKEADDILEAARRKALAREREIVEEAHEEATRIITRANREVELEKKKALDDLKQEMVSVAAQMAGKAIGSSMTPELEQSLLHDALREIEVSTWQS